jgi:hypothetical protein
MRSSLVSTLARHASGRAVRLTVAAGLAAATSLAAGNASAQRELLNPMGNRGTLVIDQLAGFRASSIGGIGYAGPVGFATQNLSVDINDNQGRNAGSNSIKYTTFWIAPSADYFVIDHLSIGGVIEFASTSSTLTRTTIIGGVTNTVTASQPTVTNITFLPRIGWMFDITDRFGIWPRGGIGYASRQSASIDPIATGTDTTSAFVFDIDVGFLYRMNENWFFKGTPELTFGPGSTSHTVTAGGTTTSSSTGSTMFQFAVVGGVGVMWDLL